MKTSTSQPFISQLIKDIQANQKYIKTLWYHHFIESIIIFNNRCSEMVIFRDALHRTKMILKKFNISYLYIENEIWFRIETIFSSIAFFCIENKKLLIIIFGMNKKNERTNEVRKIRTEFLETKKIIFFTKSKNTFSKF